MEYFQDYSMVVECLLRELVGSSFTGVHYITPSGGEWSGDAALMHEVAHGITFVLADGREMVVAWETFDDFEFLLVSRSADDIHLSLDSIDIVDVSNLGVWQRRIGVTIESVAVSYHEQGESLGKSIWALRFCLENGDSFVVALGEIQNGIASYLPDSIVVLFARSDAEALWHRGSLSSAWGLILK